MTARRLILLRHAKSSWSTGNDDHNRPLNGRGRRDAPAIADALLNMGWVPQVVVSSDAQRTRETWALMQGTLGGRAQFTRDLYLADVEAVIDTLIALPDERHTAMLIGHNPGWEDALAHLTGEHEQMTTCNAALLTVEAPTWARAARRTDWVLEALIRPRSPR